MELSSRPLFSPLQPFQLDQKEFKDVREYQAQQQQKDTPGISADDQLLMHMQSNKKLMQVT
jgi:hypothetical protein